MDRWPRLLPLLALAAGLGSGCPSTVAPDAGSPAPDGGPPDAGPRPDGGPAVTSLAVRVLTLDGLPLAASVGDGPVSRATGIDGVAQLGTVVAGRHLVHVSAPGYLEAAVPVWVPEGVAVSLPVYLLVQGPPVRFDAARGVNTLLGEVWVQVPKAAVVDGAGATVTGQVAMTVSPIAPTTRALLAAPPLTGTPADGGAPVSLDPVFMADVSLWGPGGERLGLRPDSGVTLGYPVAGETLARYPVGSRIAAWWFDLDAGVWVEEGQGTIVADPTAPDAGARWVASVRHLSRWNSDAPFPTTCLKVTVLDQDTGRPLPGAGLYERGYWNNRDLTGTDGTACVTVAQNATVELLAESEFHALASTTVRTPGQAGYCRGILPGVDCMPLTVQLRVEPDACLSGRVEEADGRPVALATVIGVVTGARSSVTLTRTTGADGTYCLPVPRNAPVQLSARRVVGNASQDTELVSTSSGGQATCGGAGACAAAPTLRFRRSCLAGRVLSDTSMPIAGAQVEGTYVASGVTYRSQAETGASGEYCLDAPRNVEVRVRASKTTSGLTQTSSEVRAATPDAELACGSPSCGAVPDLRLRGTTCLSGQVQDAFASPVAEATVTALLDAASGFAAVAAVTDESGRYCLEVPAGSGYSVIGRRTLDGLPQHTDEVLGFAPSTEAACGGPGCAALPVIQFAENTCVSGTVLDAAGLPLDAVSVSAQFDDGQGETSTSLTPGPGGAFCGALPVNTRVGLSASRTRGALTSTARTWVASSVVREVCAQGTCTVAGPLRLARPTCFTGTVSGLSGQPVPGAMVRLLDDTPGLDWSTGAVRTVQADSSGHYCATVPQGHPLTVASVEPNSATGAGDLVPLTTGTGADVVCGEVGCTAGPDLRWHQPGCVEGTVVDAQGAPVQGARVYSVVPFGPNDSLSGPSATTDATGAYCLQVQGPRQAYLQVEGPRGGSTGLPAAWAGTTITAPSSSVQCGTASGACTAVPPLVLSSTPGFCLSGRVSMGRIGSLPAPEGTDVYLFAGQPSYDCATDPTTWGTVAAHATVGADGRYCLQAPGQPDPTYSLQVGGCHLTQDVGTFDHGRLGPRPYPDSCGGVLCRDFDVSVQLRNVGKPSPPR